MFKILLLTILFVSVNFSQAKQENMPPVVKTTNGVLEGTDDSGIYTFKGIPFAAPPIGNLRWQPPQPPARWKGIRKADKFGPRAMQRALFGDMNFRSDGMSEDCLYLNVWTPAESANKRLPVLVYFYGGGFSAGDGSEPRYDGESIARKGIIAVTVNYRLSVFGFLAHPELTKESPHHASGNYGLMDQNAALRWVRQNIAAFGGDPNQVTIAGESAGSFSVSAQMASPLSKNLFSKAIGESGSLLGSPMVSLAEAEQMGSKFAAAAGADSLAKLRAIPASELIEATAKPGSRFPVAVDGYFFPQSPAQIFAAGKQSQVPLLVGWNSEEQSSQAILGRDKPTKENYIKALKKIYGDKSDEVLKLYNASTDDEVEQVATELGTDRFIGFGTWKWSDIHAQTNIKPVYRYMYSRPRPAMRSEMGNAIANLAGGITKNTDPNAKKAPLPRGASHSAEIEYALGNLPTNRVYDWQPEDYKVSEIMQDFFANFIKTGDPNGIGLPKWLAVKKATPAPVMIINTWTRLETEKTRERYLFLNKVLSELNSTVRP